MQISKKRELSRKSGLKEYCGDEYCQNLKFSLGQSLQQESWGPWQEAGGYWNEMSRWKQLRVCACVCVGGRGWLQLGTKDCQQPESPREAGWPQEWVQVPGQHEV